MIPMDIFCPKCAYNLHAAPGDHCPECGHSLAAILASECRIPWVQRKTLGRVRAYWQTVRLVVLRPVSFCEEYAHAVSLPDARRFQWITVILVYLTVLLAALAAYGLTPFEAEFGGPPQQVTPTAFVPQGPTFVAQAYAEFWPVALLYACFFLFLLAATGVPSYFFHPSSVAPRQQNNAVAMSYYASAPLAFFPAALVVLIVVASLTLADRWVAVALWAPVWAGGGAFLIPCGCVFGWWWTLLQLSRRTMPLHTRRHAALALCLPLIWLGLAFLLVGLLPLLVLYVLMVIVSFGA